MSYTNPFQKLLQQVSEDAGWVLQLVHNTRGARLAELAPELESARILKPEQHLRDLENHLERRRRQQLAHAVALRRRRPGRGRAQRRREWPPTRPRMQRIPCGVIRTRLLLVLQGATTSFE